MSSGLRNGVTIYIRKLLAQAKADARSKVRKYPANHPRPKNRGECRDMPRPCPYVGCRYHLFLSVTVFGSIEMPYGEDVEALQRMPDTCALDVAERPRRAQVSELAKQFRVSGTAISNTIIQGLGKLGELPAIKECHPHQTKAFYVRRQDKPLYSPRQNVEARRKAAGDFAADSHQ